jgi:hypothetical protein
MYMFSVDEKWHGRDAEFAYTLKVDEKSDVYSFGVVVLDLVPGPWFLRRHLGIRAPFLRFRKTASLGA